uniref:Uncharacterized protein n=1 Tax=Romanomermis culicivorax TaxID=13658 RepID=A0A915HUG5_ROMCU
MVYFLLLDRKRRKPTFDDETTVFLKSGSIFDPPRKRIDTAKATKYSLGSISDGSPINPRKTYGRLRYSSSNGSPYVSPMPVAKNSTFCARSSYKIAPSFNYFTTSSAQASPKPEHSSNFTSHDPKSHNNNNNTYSFKDIQATVERKLSSDLIPTQSADTTGKSSVVKSTPPTSPLSQRSKWRSRFSSLKSSILTGTPRYHRKKSGDTDVSDSEDGSVFDTTDLVKKSWFDSLASSFSSDKDEMILFTVNKKSLNAVKAELIRAFLAVHELNHTIVDHNSFRLEFRKANVSSTTSMFIRTVRITVQIVPAVGKEDLNDRKVSKPFNVHFILISGSLRRFKRLVEHLIVLIKSFDHSPRSSDQPSDQKFACMVRPRKLSVASVDSTTSPDVTSAVLSPGILSPLSTDQRIISTSRLEASNENSQCTVMINRWATTRESIISSKSPDDQSINFRLKTERYKYQSPHPPPMDQSDLADDVRRTPSNERRKYQQQSHKPIVEKISTPLLGRRIFPENNGLPTHKANLVSIFTRASIFMFVTILDGFKICSAVCLDFMED